jgi:hypothetical protein
MSGRSVALMSALVIGATILMGVLTIAATGNM